VTKEVAKTSVKIHKPPPVIVCNVNDFKQLMIKLKLEEAEGHEQQIKTLANGEIKILTGDEHQFRNFHLFNFNSIFYFCDECL